MRNLISFVAVVVVLSFVLMQAQIAFAFEIPKAIGLEPAGMLPTNPFYFVKEIGWGIKRLFTFGSVGKAELELTIAEKKLSEIKKLSETGKDEKVIAKATQDYQDSLNRLKNKVEALKDTSKNPDIDKLLGNVVMRGLIHQEIFENLRETHSGINDKLSNVDFVIDDVIATVPLKDSPERFSERIKEVYDFLEEIEFVDSNEATLKAVEAIELIGDKVNSEDLKEKFIDIKEGFSSDTINDDSGVIIEINPVEPVNPKAPPSFNKFESFPGEPEIFEAEIVEPL